MSNQQPRMFRREGTTPTEIRYLLYLPRRFDAESGERYPLVLFLHGSGERGDDLGKLKRTGLPEFLERSDEYPFVVVSPQCPRDEDWEDVDLSALLDEATGLYAADPDRVYLTGLSMGGFGAWELATARPDAFAALAPICGGGDPARACELAHVPTWVFHGALDTVVLPARSEEMVAALKACGGDVRHTVYPNAGHDSWTETYADPALYEWMLSLRRRERA